MSSGPQGPMFKLYNKKSLLSDNNPYIYRDRFSPRNIVIAIIKILKSVGIGKIYNLCYYVRTHLHD